MRDETRVEAARQPQWMFYREGVYGPSDEKTLREFGDRIGIFSDEKGIASGVMRQMWAEIDRLRSVTAALAAADAAGWCRDLGKAPRDGTTVWLMDENISDELGVPPDAYWADRWGQINEAGDYGWQYAGSSLATAWMRPLPAPPEAG